jgi:MFS family permease
MVPLRLLRNRTFAIGNAVTFLMSGTTFTGAYLVTQEFQFARGYSPLSAGLRLLPFFATPMVISPLAGALSDRAGRRPLMVTGLALLSAGYWWVAATDSVTASWTGLTLGLLVSGVGVSMALPIVPAAVLGAVTPAELGKASGINYMAQRFGAVFAVAIATAVFSASGHLGSPASVIAGFRPALATCAGLALLAAVCATAITSRPAVPPIPAAGPVPEPAEEFSGRVSI